MRIVYNLRDQDRLGTKSLGILHVSTRVLAALAADPRIEEVHVLANRSLAADLAPLAKPSHCFVHFSDTPAPRRWARLAWDHWHVAHSCDRLQPDWLLLPKGFAPLVRWPRCRVSAYVHDNVFGYYSRTRERPFPRGEAWLFKRMLQRTAGRANLVVTNSSFTADEFRRAYSPSFPVVRIGAPVSAKSNRTSATQRSPATLFLPTSPWPHKLTAQAIAWTARWAAENSFAGTIEGYGSLPAGVAWPADMQWIHHGRIEPVKLAELEACAGMLIYFSAYEGYGLPPVEALAAGRRAIASDIPALRETLPAACLFPNDNYAAFARALSTALTAPPPRPLRVDTPAEVATAWCDALLKARRT